MGKRKERRLAAKASSNRRVKLDLFAEPSGEMMDNSVHDEVGGDLDQDHAGAPTSPSSSGQRQENPLLLLGQYSDDELDEEDSKRPKLAADENFTTDLDGQDTEADVSVGNTEEALTACNNEQELDLVNAVKNVDGNDIKENVSNNESAQYCDTAPAPPVNIPECAGDATSGWKMVMHEESNRYYYWNTLTGETSWEVPTDLAGEHNVSSAVDGAVVHADIHVPTHLNPESEAYGYVSSADGLGGSNLISSEAGDYGGALVATNENGEVAHMAYDVSQSLTHYSTAAASIPYVHSSAQPDFVSPLQSNGVGPDVHSASLVNYSESLLQRLEALDRSGHRLERHELIVNEIEIRLTDCKALSSYGSSLLPFWWHVEAQLKQLEAVISKGEASWLIHSKHNSKLETPQVSSLINECSLQSIETESEVIEKDKVVSHIVEHSCSSPAIGDASKVGIETSSQLPNSNDVKIDNQHLGSVQEPYIAPESNPDTPIKLESELESHAEDVDMDVEMEVDEEVQPVQEAVGDQPILSSHEQLSQSYQPSPECPPDSLDESSVPPPPEEEWIPPPPPDSELVPPPPPEEPEPAIPLPHAEAISYPAYHDSYNLPYTASVYEYYAPTAGEPMNVNYYAPAGGTHIADPHATPYYEPVVASSVEVNPVQPVGYYDVSSGAGPPGPVDSSMGSSGYYIESEPISYCYTVSASDHTSSLGFSMDSGNSKLPVANLESGTTTAITEPQMCTSHSISNASTVQPVATPLVNGADVKAPSSTIPKGQTKVVRSKKRTVAAAPALRSNKKVASLVDKWKAAKEELHGDEDEDEEPENAYEVLEKKRQKEIEEWRVRQIASGEAQDNANFLPLGGDWRERVKRKKAAAKAEAVQSPLEIVENARKQPDLVELSKDLPSGWQAYWDESTKEVYYGNNITSETTWTKPAR